MIQIIKRYFQHSIDQAVRDDASNMVMLAEVNKKAAVLDLGTGPAMYFQNSLLRVKRKIQSSNVTATDISSGFIKEAEKHGLKGKVVDLSKPLPFEENTFDVILSNQVIEHLFDIDQFVSEIYRVLKPGGYAIIGTENLSAWYNIWPLFLGFHPFIATSISYTGSVGNPFALHKNDSIWNKDEKRWMSHCKVFSYQAFVDMFRVHHFAVEKVTGAGYYPLPNFIGRYFARLDVRHSCRMQIKVRKPQKSKKGDEAINEETMKKKQKVIIVMPAYNAEQTLEKTFRDIPKGLADEVILVDDASNDKTAKLAKKLGIRVIAHKENLGYGGNQKTCYDESLKKGADIVVMLHPDYQYDATRLGELIRPIQEGRYDAMFGSRIRTRQEALDGGMPMIKYILNRLSTPIENIILGVNFSEHFSGLRAYSREVLRKVPYRRFSDDFMFDQQFMASAISYGFRISEIPVPVRYFNEASSIGFRKGSLFLLGTGNVLLRFMLHQNQILKSRWFKK